MEELSEDNLLEFRKLLGCEDETSLHTVIRLGCSAKAIKRVLKLDPSAVLKEDRTHGLPLQLYLDTLCTNFRPCKKHFGSDEGMEDLRSYIGGQHLSVYKEMREAFDRQNEKLKPEEQFILQPRHLTRELMFVLNPYAKFQFFTLDFIKYLIRKGGYSDGSVVSGGEPLNMTNRRNQRLLLNKIDNFSTRVILRYRTGEAREVFDLLKEQNRPVDMDQENTLANYLLLYEDEPGRSEKKVKSVSFDFLEYLIKNGSKRDGVYLEPSGKKRYFLHERIKSKEFSDSDLARLVKVGFDMTVRDSDVLTPLALYLEKIKNCHISEEHVNLVQAFIDAGADPNTKNMNGDNFLHMAIENGTSDMIRMAITEMEISANETNSEGMTALDKYRQLPRERQDNEIVAILTDASEMQHDVQRHADNSSLNLDWIEGSDSGRMITELLYLSKNLDEQQINELACAKNKQSVFDYIKNMINEEKPAIIEAALDRNTNLGRFFSIKGKKTSFFSKTVDFEKQLNELQAVIQYIAPPNPALE